MREARIEVDGRVQGVGFRNNVKKFADNLSLRGTEMNLSNGRVLIVVQGEEENINNMIVKLKESPGLSKVENVEVNWGKVVKKYNDFMILREGNFLVDKFKSIYRLFERIFEKKTKIENVPKHIVIIPDGNRRWARSRGLEPHFGHYKAGSYANMESLFKEAKNLGVKCASIWGFSTENWKRSKEERKAIFDLILAGVERFREDAHKNRMGFRHIGRKDRLPKKLVNGLRRLEKETEKYKDFIVQLCLDYGGRDEIVRAVNKILLNGKKKVDEAEFSDYLDSAGIGDPDLIIRTGGEKRLSGFMPFQASYAELYFSGIYFPEFGAFELRKAIKEYGKRVRRFGGDV